MTRKWIKVNDLLNRQYSANKNSIQGLTSILRLDLCDYSKAYIAAKRRITVIETNNANKRNKKLSLIIMFRLDHACQRSTTQS